MTINLRTCEKCSRYLVNLGWGYYSHPPLLDHFGNDKAPEYQCSDMGKMVKLP